MTNHRSPDLQSKSQMKRSGPVRDVWAQQGVNLHTQSENRPAICRLKSGQSTAG